MVSAPRVATCSTTSHFQAINRSQYNPGVFGDQNQYDVLIKTKVSAVMQSLNGI